MMVRSSSTSDQWLQDPWEQFKSRQNIGAIWLTDDFECVGQADELSNRLFLNLGTVVSHKQFPQDRLFSALQKVDRPALLTKKPTLSDIREVLDAFIESVEVRGKVPEEGIKCGTTMLVRGPRKSEAIDDWFAQTIAATERWTSSRHAENPADLHSKVLMQDDSVMAEAEHTKKDSPRGEVIDLRGISISPPATESPLQIERALLLPISAYADEHPERAAALASQLHELASQLMKLANAIRPPTEERILTLPQAAERTGLSESLLSRLCRRGKLGEMMEISPNVRPKPRFSEVELDAYMASERKPGPKRGWKNKGRDEGNSTTS